MKMTICFGFGFGFGFGFHRHRHWFFLRLIEMPPQGSALLVATPKLPWIESECGLTEKMWKKTVIWILQCPKLQGECFLFRRLPYLFYFPNNIQKRTNALHTFS